MIESGDWSRLRERLADHAFLDMSNEEGRRRIAGAEEIVAFLTALGPAEIHDWDAREWPTGVALSFECEAATGRDRRRWYMRRGPGGQANEIWSTAARPEAGDAAESVEPPAALLEQLGATGFETLSHGGNSGAALLRTTGADGAAYVLKRVLGGGGSDWLARATGDRGRTVLLYEAGAFDAMPETIGHGIVAVERDGDSAWVAMRDVASLLTPSDKRFSREESRRILGAVADLHRAFGGRPPDGAASLRDRIGMSSPAIGEAERTEPDLLPKQFEQGWDALGELVDADVAEPVLRLAREAGPLADAMIAAQGEATLIHGDVRGDNLGLDGDRVVLIDWDVASAGTPGAEFAWYLAHGTRRIDATHDEIEADHRAAQGDYLVDDELELGMISGLVQYGWRIAHSARVHPGPAETEWGRKELEWWVPRVRRALERTGGPLG